MTCLKEVTRYQLCINVHHKKHMHWVEYNYIFIGCSTGAAWQLICQYWTHLLQIWPLLLLICCPYVLYYMLHAGYVARFNTSFWLLCRSSFIEKTKNFFWFFYYFFKELFLELYKDVWRHVSIIRWLICSLISPWVSPIIYCWYLGFSHIVMNSFLRTTPRITTAILTEINPGLFPRVYCKNPSEIFLRIAKMILTPWIKDQTLFHKYSVMVLKLCGSLSLRKI